MRVWPARPPIAGPLAPGARQAARRAGLPFETPRWRRAPC